MRSLLSVAEAAELLDLTPQTINRLIREGILEVTFEKRRGKRCTFLRREAVEAYGESRQENAPKKVHLRAAQAVASVRSLERRVAFLEDALGARLQPPTLEEESVAALLAEADDDLNDIPNSPNRILYWARFFLSVGEEFFSLLETVTEDGDNWMIFHDLGQAISEAVSKDDMELQAALAYLEVGRRNLRAVLFFYLQGRLGMRRAMKAVGEVDDVHDEVLNFANLQIRLTYNR